MVKFFYLLMLSSLPVLMWVSVYIFLNKQSRLDSIRVSVYGLTFGIAAMMPVLFLQMFWESYPALNIFRTLQAIIPSEYIFYALFFLFVAVLEEILKALALVFLVQKFHRRFDQIVDGIVFGAFIALGFAFAENMYYFLNIVETYHFSAEFFAVFNLRSFGTMLSHTIFTGTFGIFYAIAYFGDFKSDTSFSLRKILELRFTRNLFFGSLFKPKNVYRYLVLSEGIFYAFSMHWFFNLLLKLEISGIDAVYFTIPFLLFSTFWLWSNFFDQRSLKILKEKPMS